MKSPLHRFIIYIAALCLFSGPISAANKNWFGTWVLRPELSHLTGPLTTIARTPHGFHFDFGAAAVFDIGDDGAFYPTVPTREASLRIIGPRSWLRVHRVHGKDVDRSTLTLTPDERKLVIETTPAAAGSQAARTSEVLERVDTGMGLAGTWRSTSPNLSVEQTIIFSDAGARGIKLDYPNDGNYFVAKSDGPPAPNEGTRAVPSVALALHTTSDGGLRWTVTVGGKAFEEGADVLAADGRHMTETTFMAKTPAERQRAVYERQ